MINSRIFGTENCSKLLWRFTAPAVIGMLANALNEAFDRLFIGKAAGVSGISAVTLVRPMFFIVLAFSLLIGGGASVTVSLKLGQNNKLKAEKALGNALVLAAVSALCLALFGLLFIDGLLLLFGTSKAVLPLAKQYLTIFLSGTIFMVAAQVLVNAARAEGNPKMAMNALLFGTITNFVLNPVFIFIFKLGIAGSALANLCSQFMITVWLMIYFMGRGSVLKLRLRNLLPDKPVIRQILAIGSGNLFAILASTLTLILLNKNLSYYGGDYAVAAFGIINTLAALVMLPVTGINLGMQPIVGFNYAAGNYRRVKETMGTALLWSTYLATFGFILLQLFQKQLFTLFCGQNQALFEIGSAGMRIFLIMLPVTSLQRMEYFEATGSARISIFLSLSKQILFQIPLLMILPRLYNLRGVWLTGAFSDLFSSLLSGVFLLFALSRLKNR